MNQRDRERRRLFLATFQPLFYWPTDTMAVKCWRAARERFSDKELDHLIDAMIRVNNSRAGRSLLASADATPGQRAAD